MNNSQVNNSHGMITRGKKRNNENIDIISSSSSDEEEEIISIFSLFLFFPLVIIP